LAVEEERSAPPGEEPVDAKERLTPREALEEILAALPPIDLQPGDVLLHQGHESDGAFFLQKGALQVYAETRYGPVPLATVEAPRLIGEIGAVAGLARTASVKAASAAQVFHIDRARLLELGRRSPEFLVTIVRQLGGQIDSVNKALALYANALEALEGRDFDSAILEDLTHASPHLAEFSAAFRRFAAHIVRNRRRQEEMASAALIQRSFLPDDSKLNFARDDVELRAKIRPARDVGGDFYDFIPLDSNRLALVVGDVCGKGMPASLFMSVVVTVLRMSAREEQNAASAISRANALLCQDNKASLFATCFFAVLHLNEGILEYCNCGHNAPVHFSRTGRVTRLETTGLPLAMLADRPARAACVPLEPGDALFVFSDGVTEALNPAKEELGDALLLETLLKNREAPVAELVSTVFEAVDAFACGEPQADDITCIAVRRRARSDVSHGTVDPNAG
jgi:phosphoserine phosphatase RsbU/P